MPQWVHFFSHFFCGSGSVLVLKHQPKASLSEIQSNWYGSRIPIYVKHSATQFSPILGENSRVLIELHLTSYESIKKLRQPHSMSNIEPPWDVVSQFSIRQRPGQWAPVQLVPGWRSAGGCGPLCGRAADLAVTIRQTRGTWAVYCWGPQFFLK